MSNRYIYLTLLAVLGWNAETAAQNGARQVPRLVVNITIDQLRSDYLEAYAPLYSANGFRKLLEQGKVYENASYPMQETDRASAVSTVITGTVPYYHSIIGQRWIERETLRPILCTETLRQNGTPSPAQLSVSTLGDELKVATNGEARVFAIAPFCDAAILTAGHAADGALWLDEQTGQWMTSQYYSNQTDVPLLSFNKINEISDNINHLFWTPLGQEAKPDFKYTFKDNKKYQEYQTSALINNHMTDWALLCANHQMMGADMIPDLLCLTYYAGPYNHRPMTECQQEMRDTYLRLDRSISQLITRLETSIGAGNVLFVLTGTGYCDPEYTDYARYRIPTGTFYINRAANLLNMYFGALWGQERYIETWFGNQLYINHKLLEQKHISLSDFSQRAKEFLVQMEGVRNVYTTLQLLGGDSSLMTKIRNGFHPSHSGDILIEVAPGWQLQNEETGENRMSQTPALAFPIVFYGAGIQPERILTPVTTDRIAPTISRAIRIRAPNACTAEPLF